MTVLEAARPPEAVAERLSVLALGRFYERYGPWINAALWWNPGQVNPGERKGGGA